MIYVPCPAGYQTKGRPVCQLSDGGNCSGISCSTYRSYLFDFIKADVPRDFVPPKANNSVGQRVSRDGLSVAVFS